MFKKRNVPFCCCSVFIYLLLSTAAGPPAHLPGEKEGPDLVVDLALTPQDPHAQNEAEDEDVILEQGPGDVPVDDGCEVLVQQGDPL